jgi:hypothetical protein
MLERTVLETCQLVLDRPAQGDPHALMYVAEAKTGGRAHAIATSPVFHPELDPTAHRAALAQLESHLAAQGWQREVTPTKALIGVRFHRWRGLVAPV